LSEADKQLTKIRIYEKSKEIIVGNIERFSRFQCSVLHQIICNKNRGRNL
jgi:hypothetical protein